MEKNKFKKSINNNSNSQSKEFYNNKNRYNRRKQLLMENMRDRVLENPDSIQYMNNPPEEIIKIAIRQDVNVIKHIKNPSSEIIKLAKEIAPKQMKNYYKAKNNRYIQVRIGDKRDNNKLKLLSNEGVIELLNNKGDWLQFIKNQTEEMVLAAITNKFESIQYVNNISLDVLKKLVELYPDDTKKYVINEEKKLIKSSQSSSKCIFDYVIRNLSIDEVSSLVNSNIKIVKHMDKVPCEIQMQIVKKSYSNLKYIKNIDVSIYKYLYNDSNFEISSIEDNEVKRKIQDCFNLIKSKINETNNIQEYKEYNQNNFSPVVKKVRKISFDRNIIHELWDNMKHDLIDNDFSFRMIDSEVPINEYLILFAKKIAIKNINIASGFVYKSGLDKLKKIFDIVNINNGEINLIIGSLKDYCNASAGNKLINIDLETVEELSGMIQRMNCKIYTLESKFFHGKYYFLKGEYYSCCMIGSSNLTTSGFFENYELNTLYLVKNNSPLYATLYNWFIKFRQECLCIESFDESCFINSQIQFDTVNSNKFFSVKSIDDVKNLIKSLSDEELKFRLNTWLEKKPSGIYTDLKLNYFKDYIVFEYKDINLIVLESLEFGNGFYWFEDMNVFELVLELKYKTRTEAYRESGMDKRGYHNYDRKTFKAKVDNLFKRRIKYI